MKKLVYLFSFFLTMLVVTNVSAAANSEIKSNKVELTTEQKARVLQIIHRVDQIKSMDRSAMSATERKAVRQELRQLKKEAQAITSGGVYLSVGAILIIILLLIILL